MRDVSSSFAGRLRARDPQAWFELWETFGPILRAQLSRWGGGRIGKETVQDLSQETMAALADAIDRHDPTRGARFSSWLLAIAKYTLGGEIDRRMALKRGGGQKPVELEEAWAGPAPGGSPDQSYERQIFDAKVTAAMRVVERESELLDFEIFRMRILEGRPGREVARQVGVSEPTVSRRLSKVRESLRQALGEVMARYSFTDEEYDEAGRNGVDPNPTKAEDQLFDEAIGEIYHRGQAIRAHEA